MKKIVLSILLISLICVTGSIYATEAVAEDGLELISTMNVEDLISSIEDTGVDAILEENSNANTDTDVNVNTEIVEEDDIIYDDVYLLDTEVNYSGKQISGNLYVLAEKVRMDSVIVDGNVFILGQDVELKDSVFYGSAYILAEDLESNSQMRDLYLLGDELDLKQDFYVDRSARILGVTTKFNGMINNNCYLLSDKIELLESAIIGGTFTYYSQEEAKMDENASVGNIDFHKQEEVEKNTVVEETISIADKATDVVGGAFKSLVIAIILVFASEKPIKANKNMTVGTFFKGLAFGCLLLIFIPLISIMLMISIFGIGLGLILLIIYIIMLYASCVLACISIASKLVKDMSKWKVVGLSVLIYTLIRLVSAISGWGILISMVLGLAGLGFMVMNLFYKEKAQDVIIQNNV